MRYKLSEIQNGGKLYAFRRFYVSDKILNGILKNLANKIKKRNIDILGAYNITTENK